MKEIDDLRTEIAENKTVIDSAVALIRGLKERLDLAIGGGDPAQALRDLRDDLNRNEQALAQAIAENTPTEGGGGSGEPGTGGETGGGTTDPGAGTGGPSEGGDTGITTPGTDPNADPNASANRRR